ncbi:Opine oxidase subunit B [Fusarium mexicanum]|uniref:Opine oxidase subunit B n=1 Tax=Fusarium mexicanum TaxID=751941 RepID=A0A8H5IIV4_9HYPO|nr:Opine oxidase subunit B [Fusarium mexicanum]
MPYIKQIVAIRRKPGLTRQEFFDYHFQVHGKLSQGPSPDVTPSKYFQTHIQDAVYNHQEGRGVNANPWWGFSDDIVELYFQSEDHMKTCFSSQYAREHVGPDGVNFSDFVSALPVTVQERVIPLHESENAPSEDIDTLSVSPVAMYYLTVIGDNTDDLITGFANSLQKFAGSQVRALVANIPVELGLNPDAYFGSNPDRPKFNLILSIQLHSKEGFAEVRKAQKEFEAAYGAKINLPNSWIAFGQRGLVLDQDKNVQFDLSRQPKFPARIAVNMLSNFPSSHKIQLEAMERSAQPHVIVVGGGIVGASIAWHLAHHTSVTIVAEDIGGPASKASFAWLNASSVSQKFYYNFRRRSLQRWRQIHAELPDLPISWSGSINWHKTTEVMAQTESNLTAWGYNVVNIKKPEVSECEPFFDQSTLPDWALYYPREGSMEAHVVAQMLVESAETRNNVKVIRATAKGLFKDNDKVAGVELASGEKVLGDHIVVAAGLGTVPLLATGGISVPITSVPALIVNSKPIEERLVSRVVNSKYLYIRQTSDGIIKAGCENPGDDPGDDPEATAHQVFSKVQSTLVGGENLKFDHYTIGYKPTPRDSLPIIGPTGLEGVSVAVMHSGVTNAAIVGELLSKQIITGEMDPELDNFRLDRFNN